MSRQTIQVGATLTNGNTVVRVTGRGKTGWRGLYISLSQYREQYTGRPTIIPDLLLEHWSHVPFEWSALPDSGLEHRYVWQKGCRWLRHELRKAGKS